MHYTFRKDVKKHRLTIVRVLNGRLMLYAHVSNDAAM